MYYYYVLLIVMVIGSVRFVLKEKGGYYLIGPYFITIIPLWFLILEKLPHYQERFGISLLMTILLVCFRIVYRLK